MTATTSRLSGPTALAEKYEYAGKVAAHLQLPGPEVDGPPLVFIETEHLGYVPLTVDQAERLADNLTAIVAKLRAVNLPDGASG